MKRKIALRGKLRDAAFLDGYDVVLNTHDATAPMAGPATLERRYHPIGLAGFNGARRLFFRRPHPVVPDDAEGPAALARALQTAAPRLRRTQKKKTPKKDPCFDEALRGAWPSLYRAITISGHNYIGPRGNGPCFDEALRRTGAVVWSAPWIAHTHNKSHLPAVMHEGGVACAPTLLVDVSSAAADAADLAEALMAEARGRGWRALFAKPDHSGSPPP